jgi:hypothetical protein
MSDTDFPSVDALFDVAGKKSRAVVLEFDGVAPGREARFRDELVADIGRAREQMMGGHGFLVKEASYFTHGKTCYIVLVSRDALLYKKWRSVHSGIGAKNMTINSSGISASGKTSNSLHGILETFATKTTGLELSNNLVRYNQDPVRVFHFLLVHLSPPA